MTGHGWCRRHGSRPAREACPSAPRGACVTPPRPSPFRGRVAPSQPPGLRVSSPSAGDAAAHSSLCDGSRTEWPDATARSIASVVSRLMRACSGVGVDGRRAGRDDQPGAGRCRAGPRNRPPPSRPPCCCRETPSRRRGRAHRRAGCLSENSRWSMWSSSMIIVPSRPSARRGRTARASDGASAARSRDYHRAVREGHDRPGHVWA